MEKAAIAISKRGAATTSTRRILRSASSSLATCTTTTTSGSTCSAISVCTAISKRALSTTTTAMSDAGRKAFEQKQAQIKEELKEEADFLTKSLYRTCLRSIRHIRPGNEHDEAEFQRREEKRLEEDPAKMEEDIRMGMFSMLPPVDREDELRSRAEYYHQYARENLVQESDCLPFEEEIMPLKEAHVSRFLHFLFKGEKDRKWLLKDMKFSDPYENSFPEQRARDFEKKALAYVRENEKVRQQLAGVPMYDEFLDQLVDEDDDDEHEDSDSDGEEYPAWFREKYPEKSR